VSKSITMYNASIPVLVHAFKSLSAILDKAHKHAVDKKIDDSVFLNYRLSADMFPMSRQVQIAGNYSMGFAARMAGKEVPVLENTETSFTELTLRISRIVDYLNAVDPSTLIGSEDRDITFPVGGQPKTFKGIDYLTGFVLPNVYFHISICYAILRHAGVDIGKNDYLGTHI
jgi:uncharacterized protein